MRGCGGQEAHRSAAEPVRFVVSRPLATVRASRDGKERKSPVRIIPYGALPELRCSGADLLDQLGQT